jgi:hypothetical protein
MSVVQLPSVDVNPTRLFSSHSPEGTEVGVKSSANARLVSNTAIVSHLGIRAL